MKACRARAILYSRKAPAAVIAYFVSTFGSETNNCEHTTCTHAPCERVQDKRYKSLSRTAPAAVLTGRDPHNQRFHGSQRDSPRGSDQSDNDERDTRYDEDDNEDGDDNTDTPTSESRLVTDHIVTGNGSVHSGILTGGRLIPDRLQKLSQPLFSRDSTTKSTRCAASANVCQCCTPSCTPSQTGFYPCRLLLLGPG